MTVRMDGEIPEGLQGQERAEAVRHCRETMMQYTVRWRHDQSHSEVPNLVLKPRAPQAIITFFEASPRLGLTVACCCKSWH